jgi:hypothetical protein
MHFAARRCPWARGMLPILSLAYAVACSTNTGERVGTSSLPIIGGTDSVPSQNFAVLIVHPTTDTQYYECTGSLVAPNLVLTARHCVSATADMGFTCSTSGEGSSGGDIGADFDPSTLEIFAGLTRPVDFTSPAAVGEQVFHDTATNLCNHDVALIGLSHAVSVPGVEIATLQLAPQPTAGEQITAVGWGVTESTQSPMTRQQRTGISILHVGPYSDSQGNDVPPNEFDDGESICEGDSGSPALNSSNAVIGVASRGGNNMTPEAGDLAASCEGAQTLNYYSAIGAFGSVILQAFNAMGATPKLVGGASLGGSCVTSIECLSGICLGSGTNGYCSESCAMASCPSGYSCGTASGEQVCEQDPASSGGCNVGPELGRGRAAADETLRGFCLGVVFVSTIVALRRRKRLRATMR